MLAPPLSFSRRLVMGRAWSNTLTTNRHLGLALQDVSFVLGVLGCDANIFSLLFILLHLDTHRLRLKFQPFVGQQQSVTGGGCTSTHRFDALSLRFS